jgi:hypothetical protein
VVEKRSPVTIKKKKSLTTILKDVKKGFKGLTSGDGVVKGPVKGTYSNKLHYQSKPYL